MFGRKKKQAESSNQVPYPVYETLRRPSDERRLWAIRLVVVLLVVTGLILGGRALSNYLLDGDVEPAPGSQEEALYDDAANGDANQPAATPATPPADASKAQAGEGSGTTNNSTVRKPE